MSPFKSKITRLSRVTLLLTTLALFTRLTFAQDLPSPATGGKAGGPISVLFILQNANIAPVLDPTVAARLKERGYLIQAVSDREPLTAAYLHQFNTVVVVGIDDFYGGGYYGVGGLSLINTAKNVELIQNYVAQGGGLVVTPIMGQAGSQVAGVLDTLLAPWKMRVGWESLRDDKNLVDDWQHPDQKTEYAWTRNVVASPLTTGVKALAYPTQVMRWDDAYATNPLYPEDPQWQILARGGPESRGMRYVGGSLWINGDGGPAPVLAAARQAGKGRVAVVGIGGYFVWTHAFAEKDERGERFSTIGENHTGPMEGIVYSKGDGKTSSDWGVLLDNVLRYTGSTGAAAGFGGTPAPWKVEKVVGYPDNPIPPFAVVDWKTQALPATWAHHAPDIAFWRGQAFYDEIPDPLAVAPQRMNKLLIGAHSAYSDGKGTVAQWAAAAKAAGFSAVVFTERFENFKAENWPRFVDECEKTSSKSFACLPGLDIADSYGNRFLLMGNNNFPAKNFLTPDGKALLETARLSLGFSQHIAGIGRPGSNKGLPSELYRHFQAIPVYTYGEKAGKYQMVDDGLASYQWQLDNASNPVPIIVHELKNPGEVAKRGTVGFQLIVPSQDAQDAVRYFRYGMDHFFENPARYYVSEGPEITGWSVFNKDIGSAELNRDHFRCIVGAATTDPTATIKEAVLYDRSQPVRRWLPGQKQFSALVDGEHGYQRYYMMVVTDSKGRRAITPHLRTVARGYYTRCGDRQNWFGAAGAYTGIWPSGRHGIRYVDPEFAVGAATESFDGGPNNPLATELSLPFASNAVTFTDYSIDARYLQPVVYGMDAWRIHNVEPSHTYGLKARVKIWHDVPTAIEGYGDALQKLVTVEAAMHSKISATPATPVFPVIQRVANNAAYTFITAGARSEGKLDGKATTVIDLPAGASIGDILLIEPLAVSGDGKLGWRAVVGKPIPAGTSWHAAYQYIPLAWRESLGAESTTPWKLDLAQGKLDSVLGVVHLEAAAGGVAGQLHAGGPVKVLPLAISGLNDGWPAALSTPANAAYSMGGLYQPVALPGTQSNVFLANIGINDGIGYAALPAEKDTAFYVGHTLTASDPALRLSYTSWTSDGAGIEVHNPTDRVIQAHLESPESIKGRYRVNTDVKVPAGTTVRLSLP